MALILGQSLKVDNAMSYYLYLSTWEETMRQEYGKAASKWEKRKAKDKNKRDNGAYSGQES